MTVKPNSGELVFPKITKPESKHLWVKVSVKSATFFALDLEPSEVIVPSKEECKSFNKKGTPKKGPFRFVSA